MADEKDELDFVFQEEQIAEWQEDILAWGEEQNLSELEVCIVLGVLYECLKEQLGIENSVLQMKPSEEDLH